MTATASIPVVVSPALPIRPTDEEYVVRIVRHGLADVLQWLGEDVGPKPGDATHAIVTRTTVFVSPELSARLSAPDSPKP